MVSQDKPHNLSICCFALPGPHLGLAKMPRLHHWLPVSWLGVRPTSWFNLRPTRYKQQASLCQLPRYFNGLPRPQKNCLCLCSLIGDNKFVPAPRWCSRQQRSLFYFLISTVTVRRPCSASWQPADCVTNNEDLISPVPYERFMVILEPRPKTDGMGHA